MIRNINGKYVVLSENNGTFASYDTGFGRG